MRAIGMAERALGLLIERAKERVAFGKRLADQANVQDMIAESRIDIDQTRLLVQKTAWLIDTYGAKGARTEISAIKVAAPNMAVRVIDRAIEVYGAAGVSDETPLAYFYAWARSLRIVDAVSYTHLDVYKRQTSRCRNSSLAFHLHAQKVLLTSIDTVSWLKPWRSSTFTVDHLD